ncbi:MAG: TraB/GumN family protein [Thermoplasmatales archaeon]|jgi:pheromone shutdown protein TraB|nr:MAG: TraB/GumN family protein [Thermoplasmatales archaeon]
MITLIGTGHVFNLSQALLSIFDEKQPDILCVELDKQRFNALMLKQTDPEKYKESTKNQPVIYKMLARFQDGMAQEYGVQAGEEMLTTVNYAQSHHLPIAFIDMNAQNLFRKMLRQMTFREKIRLMFSGLGGFFVSKKRVEKELSNIEKDFDKYIEKIGEKFPTIKRVLIDERNQYMVHQLSKANEKFEKIVAVVGDGHIPGFTELLKKKEIDFESIRLSELRKKSSQDIDSTSASFTIEHKEL